MLIQFEGTLLAPGEHDYLRLELTDAKLNDILIPNTERKIIKIKIKKYVDHWLKFAEENRGAICKGTCKRRQYFFKGVSGYAFDLIDIREV